MAQRINEQCFRVAPIEPKSHLLKVGFKMFCRNPMPRTDDASLQKGESRFDSVGMNVPVNVDLRFVLDRFVALCEAQLLHCRGVRVELIGHDNVNVFAHVVFDVLCQRAALGVLGMKEATLAAALTQANDDLLFAKRIARFLIADLSFASPRRA